LQSGTSHFLGQNFAKAYDVKFLAPSGELEYVWGTSWGASTRLVGGVIMTHGDDAGLRLPPAIAPVQVVIVPIYRSDDERGRVLEVATKIRDDLAGNGVRVRLDDRDQHRPGFKFSEWELKGVPVRIEIGPRDVDAGTVVLATRTGGEKLQPATAEAVSGMAELLLDIQRDLYEEALAFREASTTEIESFGSFKEGLEERGGLWVGAWCGDADCEAKITEETKATIRVLPLAPEDPGASCVHCGSPGAERATWARAY
jgi:prolyl-tRNA synthetase